MPAPSRRIVSRALLAALLGFAAAFVVACGSSGSGKGLLSAAESRTISSALSSVSSAVHAHSCSRAKTAVTALDDSLDGLSAGTNSKLVQNLGHGASTVSQAALTQCARTQTTATTSSTTTDTSTSVTTPSTTQSSTQSSTSASVPTTQSVPTTSSIPATSPATTPSTPATGGGSGGGGGGGGGAGLSGGGSP